MTYIIVVCMWKFKIIAYGVKMDKKKIVSAKANYINFMIIQRLKAPNSVNRDAPIHAQRQKLVSSRQRNGDHFKKKIG